MADMPGFGIGKIAENDGDQEQSQEVGRKDADGGQGAKFHEYFIPRNDKSGETGGRGGIGQKVGAADPLDHAGEGFYLVAVKHEFVVELVQHENTVLHDDHDEQGRNDPCQDGELIPEQHIQPENPGDIDHDNEHGEQGRFE